MALIIPDWSQEAYHLVQQYIADKGKDAKLIYYERSRFLPLLPSITQAIDNFLMSFSGEEPNALDELLEKFDNKVRKTAKRQSKKLGADICLLQSSEQDGILIIDAKYYSVRRNGR